MPDTPTYPGVYVQEVPSGVRTISGVPTSITAFVGYTARGASNQAKRIFSYSDFEREFGGLHRDSLVSYAVQQFYLNGGNDAYIVRVAKNTQTAKLTLEDITGTAVLDIAAANEGAWGNFIRLTVDYATSNPDSSFNLNVTRYEIRADGSEAVVEFEGHPNLSMNSKAAAFAPDVVNSRSRMIRLSRRSGFAFSEAGFSLSKSLATFPALAANDRQLVGTFDGATPFALTLANIPNDLATLLVEVNAAIVTAGLNASLAASRANAVGTSDAVGNFLKILSLNAVHEESSVNIDPNGNLALKIGMGTVNGGREKEGASQHRPVPNGILGGDLAGATGNISGAFDIQITDQSTGKDLLHQHSVNLAATPVTGLAAAIEALISGIDNAAATSVSVHQVGTFLHVLPNNANPNVSITLTGAGANAAGLQAPPANRVNLSAYSLGVGIDFAGQSGAVTGKDGEPPGASELKGSPKDKSGMYALRDVDLFNILCIPDTTILAENDAASVIAEGVAFCQDERAFYIIDPYPSKDGTTIAAWATGVSTSRNAAVYFPQGRIADPLAKYRLKDLPPSGTMAGVYARTDGQRGIWKAPAGTEATLNGVRDLRFRLTDRENGVLNPLGVNCLRVFPDYGIVSWGARTRRGADSQADEYKYVPVRRVALFIEESLYRGLKWVVFEPNDEPLWAQIRLNVGAFMHDLFRKGAFQGQKPSDAYFVKCDAETTTQTDRNLGIVNIWVGFAPLKPAEFVIIHLQQMAGQIQT